MKLIYNNKLILFSILLVLIIFIDSLFRYNNYIKVSLVLLIILLVMIFMIYKRIKKYDLEYQKKEKDEKEYLQFEKKYNLNIEKLEKLKIQNVENLTDIVKLDEIFFTILNNSNNIIFIKNWNLEFEVVNNKFLDFFDLEKESVIRKTSKILRRNFYSKEQLKNENKQNMDLLLGNINSVEEKKCFENYLKINHCFFIKKNIFIYNNEKYILGIMKDITEEVKKEKKYTNIIYNLREQIIKKEKLLSYFDKFSDLLDNLIFDANNELENLIVKLFDLSAILMEEADYSSVYIFNENKIKYLKVNGYDINVLNEAQIPKEKFYDGLIKEPHIEINDKISNIFIYENGFKSKNLAESIRIPLIIDDDFYGSMSFDIDNKSKKNYSEGSWSIMNSITKLINIVISLASREFNEETYEKSMIKVLLNTLKIHDEYTTDHSDNVAIYARKLGIKLNLSKKDIERLYWAGIVHDIGKIEIPYEILNKKDRLTMGEYELIKTHPVIGYEALSSLDSLKDISIYVKHHHERIDGDGYPDALKGDEIPYISKILTVVDSWDAMTSNRPYRKPLTLDEAVYQLKKNSGTQFDKQIVNAFLNLLYDEKVICEKLYNEVN